MWTPAPSCKLRTGTSMRANVPTALFGHEHDVTGRTAASLRLPCHTVFTGCLVSTHLLLSRLLPARRRAAAGARGRGTGPDVTASDGGAQPAWGPGRPGRPREDDGRTSEDSAPTCRRVAAVKAP